MILLSYTHAYILCTPVLTTDILRNIQTQSNFVYFIVGGGFFKNLGTQNFPCVNIH